MVKIAWYSVLNAVKDHPEAGGAWLRARGPIYSLKVPIQGVFRRAPACLEGTEAHSQRRVPSSSSEKGLTGIVVWSKIEQTFVDFVVSYRPARLRAERNTAMENRGRLLKQILAQYCASLPSGTKVPPDGDIACMGCLFQDYGHRGELRRRACFDPGTPRTVVQSCGQHAPQMSGCV